MARDASRPRTRPKTAPNRRSEPPRPEARMSCEMPQDTRAQASQAPTNASTMPDSRLIWSPVSPSGTWRATSLPRKCAARQATTQPMRASNSVSRPRQAPSATEASSPPSRAMSSQVQTVPSDEGETGVRPSTVQRAFPGSERQDVAGEPALAQGGQSLVGIGFVCERPQAHADALALGGVDLLGVGLQTHALGLLTGFARGIDVGESPELHHVAGVGGL